MTGRPASGAEREVTVGQASPGCWFPVRLIVRGGPAGANVCPVAEPGVMMALEISTSQCRVVVAVLPGAVRRGCGC